MPFKYKVNVLEKLKDKGYNTSRIRNEKLIGEATLQKIRKGEMVSWATLDTICKLLKCQIIDIIEHI